MMSCRAGKELKSAKNVTGITAESLYDTLEARQPDYKWFSAKGKIRAQTDDISVGATIQLRMLRDSVIWIRAEKLSFEVGRALITPDSAFIINRINREFYAVKLAEFLEEYNAPFGFDDLQRMLAGGTIEFPSNQLKSEPAEEFTRLRINAEEFLGLYWFDKSLDLDHSLLVDLHGRRVEMQFGDYRPVEGTGNIPFARALKLFDGESTTQLTLHFTVIELDVPTSMRFQIPSHYERVD
jgi:Domain of unknown function (DUF4292)